MFTVDKNIHLCISILSFISEYNNEQAQFLNEAWKATTRSAWSNYDAIT